MKTENVQRWDDIIFDKRNKDYGAYAIRKDYKTRVLKAEAISIGLGALIFIVPILMPNDIPLPTIPKPDPTIVLKIFDGTIEPKITPPTPPQPPRRMDASVIPTKVTSRDVPDVPPAPPSKDVTYTNRQENGTVDPGKDAIERGPGSNVIDVPAPPPYMVAPEVMPAYEGGMEGMMKFLQKKLRYPSTARRQKVEGIVYVSFIINPQGEVTNVEVVKGFFRDCDTEAVRVISLMNKWTPGLQNKVPVAVKMVLPIKFKLEN
jgi:protein TonB